MLNTTELIKLAASAVAQRKLFEGTHNGLTFSIWYDQAIPVITVSHSNKILFEELASDKPEVLKQMLANVS